MNIFHYKDRAYLILAEYKDRPDLDVKDIKQIWTTPSHPEPLLVRGRGKVYVLELIIDAEFEDLP